MKLRDWLEKECIPIATAARVLRIGRATLYGILKDTAPSIGVLYRVRRWSRGEVDLEDFLHPDEVWLGSSEIWEPKVKLLPDGTRRKRGRPLGSTKNGLGQTKISVNQVKDSIDQIKTSVDQVNIPVGDKEKIQLNKETFELTGQAKQSQNKVKSSVWGPGVVPPVEKKS